VRRSIFVFGSTNQGNRIGALCLLVPVNLLVAAESLGIQSAGFQFLVSALVWVCVAGVAEPPCRYSTTLVLVRSRLIQHLLHRSRPVLSATPTAPLDWSVATHHDITSPGPVAIENGASTCKPLIRRTGRKTS